MIMGFCVRDLLKHNDETTRHNDPRAGLHHLPIRRSQWPGLLWLAAMPLIPRKFPLVMTSIAIVAIENHHFDRSIFHSHVRSC